jgi:hypothetical protein
MRCSHRHLTIKSEGDRCSWVQCNDCKEAGPRKHSYLLAILAWGLRLTNQHPRRVRA